MFLANPTCWMASTVFLVPLPPTAALLSETSVIFDNGFKFNKQISSVVKTSFFQLRLLAKVKPYLPPKDFERVIHLFIMSRLDCCNSLYFGVDQCLLHRLQLVQNAAARLLTGKRRYDHITPILATFHWLPVVFRIKFKILLFAFKSLHGLAPQNMSELLCIHAPVRELRSARQVLLDVGLPRGGLKTKGDGAFAVAAPNLWNSLLKTHFFALAFNPN